MLKVITNNFENSNKRLEKVATWAKKNRANIKETIRKVSENDKDVASALKSINRGIPGRPRTEVEQPQLLSTIFDIVQASSSADEKCRSETIRSASTLDDLQAELKSLGFTISKSTTYLRLLPKKGNTHEAMCHV